jgi:hypothetical protein
MKAINLITIGIVVLYGAFMLDAKFHPSEKNGNSSQDAIEQLSQEIDQLKLDIITIRKKQETLAQLQVDLANLKTVTKSSTVARVNNNNASQEISGTSTAMQSDTDEAFNPVALAQRSEEQQAKKLDKYTIAFANETQDSNWSPQASELVQSFFDSEAGKKIDLHDLECRKTMCRIEVSSSEGSSEVDNLMLNFPMHVAKELAQASIFYENNDNGGNNIIIYLARNGYDLPDDS